MRTTLLSFLPLRRVDDFTKDRRSHLRFSLQSQSHKEGMPECPTEVRPHGTMIDTLFLLRWGLLWHHSLIDRPIVRLIRSSQSDAHVSWKISFLQGCLASLFTALDDLINWNFEISFLESENKQLFTLPKETSWSSLLRSFWSSLPISASVLQDPNLAEVFLF